MRPRGSRLFIGTFHVVLQLLISHDVNRTKLQTGMVPRKHKSVHPENALMSERSYGFKFDQRHRNPHL